MVTFNGKSLAKMAKGNTVTFDFYRKGELWYKINVDGKDFSFPVPISDTGDAAFLSSDKATMFMRYIRKQLEAVEKEEQSNESETN